MGGTRFVETDELDQHSVSLRKTEAKGHIHRICGFRPSRILSKSETGNSAPQV